MPVEFSWLLLSWERECLDYTFDLVAYFPETMKQAKLSTAEGKMLAILGSTVS